MLAVRDQGSGLRDGVAAHLIAGHGEERYTRRLADR
jgi:hypothetical protein